MSIIIITLLFSAFNLGAIGPIVLWQRILNLSDSLSHAIIFSLVLEYFFHLPPAIGCIFVALIFTISSRHLARETAQQNIPMIVLSSMFIAITFLVSDSTSENFKIRDFIVGDILSCSMNEMYISIVLTCLISIFLWLKFNEIVLFSVSEELAKVHRVNVRNLKLYISVMLAVTISVFIHIVGALLMTAFLVIPAASARIISRSPKIMIYVSILIAISTSLMSLALSINYDVSFSACVVLGLSLIYIVLSVYNSKSHF